MAPDWRGCSLAICFLKEVLYLKLISCFVDETGQQDMRAGYYMLTLVFHDQSSDIEPLIKKYQQRLSIEFLPDIAFHAVDLLHGHESYEDLSPETRKRLLVAFSMFVRTLPISYKTFCYDISDVKSRDALQAYIRRDLIDFLFDHLDRLQEFDKIPIYYDGGHEAVTKALRQAFDYALSKNVAVYKELSHQEKRLAQAADYICTVELAAMRYNLNDESKTYRRFFGNKRRFKQNYLKQVRRKIIRY